PPGACRAGRSRGLRRAPRSRRGSLRRAGMKRGDGAIPRALRAAGRRSEPGRGRVERLELPRRVLRGNPLRAPAPRTPPLSLPPGYDESDQRYPVLYALAGFTGRGAQLLNVTGWGESIDQRLDRLFAERRIGPMLVVFPDCFTRYGGSQYLNSSAVGRYSDY